MDIFDHRDAINSLKASLFDIYEDQEKIIGEIDSTKRDEYLNNFIRVKNLALNLINELEKLYDIDYEENFEKLNKEHFEPQSDTNNDLDKTDKVEIEKEELFSSDLSDKYYLQCDEKALPSAYAPSDVIKKLREHSFSQEQVASEEKEDEEVGDSQNSMGLDISDSEENDDSMQTFSDSKISEEDDASLDDRNENFSESKLIKIDDKETKVRGIIVRNDQYMKLALSKHRQEGILEEAKLFRISEAKRKRNQLEEKIKEE